MKVNSKGHGTWKYLLFDLDGTLTDSSEGILACVRYALGAMGREVPAESLLFGFIGPPLIESFQKITGMTEKDAVKATEKYRERYGEKGLYENRVYEGMTEVLKSLAAYGYVLAVATSKPEVYTEKILKHFELDTYFTIVAGATLDGSRNEKAQIIEEVFRRLSLTEAQKKEAIMIGDRKYDIQGAKKAGIASLGVRYGFAPEGELQAYGADYIVDNVEELSDFFGVPKK